MVRPELSRGALGSSVVELQTAINRRMSAEAIANALRVPVTGEFGPLTEQAIKYLQCVAMLKIDGIVGAKTWAFLCDGTSSLPVLQFGDSHPTVGVLQATLKGVGVFNGPVTSFFGELTEAAVQNYQQLSHLAVTGVVNRATWDKLVQVKIQGSTCYNQVYGA